MSNTREPPAVVQAVSVVLPTFNERSNVAGLIAAIRRELSSAEIVVVDDDSPDGTWELVRAIADHDPSVKPIRRTAERGLTSAIRCGIAESTGDVVVWMDCDLSMPPKAVGELVAAIERGADVATGSRYVAGGRDARGDRVAGAFSALINFGARLLLGPSVRDYTTGFVAARRRVLDEIDLRGDYGEYCIDFVTRAVRAGFRVVEVGYVCRPRERGESKTATSFPGYVRRGRKYVTTVLRLALHRGT